MQRVRGPCTRPTPIYCDNEGAKKVADNPSAEKHLKHVARRHFFVQDAYDAQLVTVPGIDSAPNMADIFTKIIDKAPRFDWLVARLFRYGDAL